MSPGRRSAGILLYRGRGAQVEVFLVHPGGPFWARRDEGAWSIPKGEYEAEQDALRAARREFTEETGVVLSGPFMPLEPVRQAGGKRILAWAVRGELDPTRLRSNRFELEWPPHSGRRVSYPEVDRGEWFALDAAQRKLLSGQRPLLGQLAERLGAAQQHAAGPGDERRAAWPRARSRRRPSHQ